MTKFKCDTRCSPRSQLLQSAYSTFLSSCDIEGSSVMDEWNQLVDAAPPNLASRLRPLRRKVLRLKARFPSSFEAACRARISRHAVVDADNMEMASRFVLTQANYTRKWLAAKRSVVFVSTELFWHWAEETGGDSEIAIGPYKTVTGPPGVGMVFLQEKKGPRLLMAPLADMCRENMSKCENAVCVCDRCDAITPLSESRFCQTCSLIAYCGRECQDADASTHGERCASERQVALSIIDNVRARASYPFVSAFYFQNGNIRLVPIPVMTALETPFIPTDLTEGLQCEEATSVLTLNAPFVQRLALRVLITDSLSDTRYTPRHHQTSTNSHRRRLRV